MVNTILGSNDSIPMIECEKNPNIKMCQISSALTNNHITLRAIQYQAELRDASNVQNHVQWLALKTDNAKFASSQRIYVFWVIIWIYFRHKRQSFRRILFRQSPFTDTKFSVSNATNRSSANAFLLYRFWLSLLEMMPSNMHLDIITKFNLFAGAALSMSKKV